VDLYEYQGRALFARHSVPVLDGGVATTPHEAVELAERLGDRVVVKAQVKVGGRGKAGGVKSGPRWSRVAPGSSLLWRNHQ
jgi:succinyl-CoA synthetase beta subunit